MLIREAIAAVLSEFGGAQTPQEIHDRIVARGLFEFGAESPIDVVRGTLRKHCAGRDRKSYHLTKYFTAVPDGRFALLDQPIRSNPVAYPSPSPGLDGAPVLVTVPEDDEPEIDEPVDGTTHWEIQWRLLDLGVRMGHNVWAPINDRGRTWRDRRVGDVPNMLDRLTLGYTEGITKTFESIDVLWLKGHLIVAGFEVEHTSSIYSGLLRMSDLSAMLPNLMIKFYLTAPDEREEKFAREVGRATFRYASPTRPLHETCRFLPYSDLLNGLERHRDVLHRLDARWLDDISIAHSPVEPG